MKKYSKRWRTVAWILLGLFLIALASFIFQGCVTKEEQTTDQENPVWMLLKLPDGNYVHTTIIKYKLLPTSAYHHPLIMIYTENRTYVAAPENVVFIQDVG